MYQENRSDVKHEKGKDWGFKELYHSSNLLEPYLSNKLEDFERMWNPVVRFEIPSAWQSNAWILAPAKRSSQDHNYEGKHCSDCIFETFIATARVHDNKCCQNEYWQIINDFDFAKIK